MWLRCRNTKSGHEASIPVGLVQDGAMPDWTPIKGAEPDATFESPVYSTASPEQPASVPGDTETKE